MKGSIISILLSVLFLVGLILGSSPAQAQQLRIGAHRVLMGSLRWSRGLPGVSAKIYSFMSVARTTINSSVDSKETNLAFAPVCYRCWERTTASL